MFISGSYGDCNDMPRKKPSGRSKGAGAGFKFHVVQWSPDQLQAVRKWIADYSGVVGEMLSNLCDAGWKVSMSQHPQTGRYLATITDKLSRPGCSNCCFIIEHNDLENAIIGACFAASELFEEGAEGSLVVDVEDDW